MPSLVAAASAWTVACALPANTPGYPLYAQSGEARLPKDQVAHLFGGISKVDQRDVSALGGAYELLPGCHTVLTQPIDLGGVTSNATMRGQIGGRTFAVPMKPGYSYLVKNTPPQIHDWARVFIAELDPGGAESQIINPATRGELDVCKQSAAGGERRPHPSNRITFGTRAQVVDQPDGTGRL